MEVFCPPTKIPLENIAKTGMYICKSAKKYENETYVMPRIGATLLKKQLASDFNVSDEQFIETYKGKGICLFYYKVKEVIFIKIDEDGFWFRYADESFEKIEDPELIAKIITFHGKEEATKVAHADNLGIFVVSEQFAFDKPVRTNKQNNSYTLRLNIDDITDFVLP